MGCSETDVEMLVGIVNAGIHIECHSLYGCTGNGFVFQLVVVAFGNIYLCPVESFIEDASLQSDT